MDPSPTQGPKMSLESLSKEEIINKYKGLLGIAKKAKQAKDESLEENRKLKEQIQQYETQKEADKKALMTMKEMLEAYTENKLQLTTQLCELQKQRKIDMENLEKMSIENESLKRQLSRLSDDNDSLLADIEKIGNELQEKQSKEHLLGRDQENNEMKEITANYHKLQRENDDLAKSINDLKEKYVFVKEINSEQRKKFNTLKDRFIEVHKKLKKLKECKRILLETQHEYADSVSQWQMEIIKASRLLCKELNDLKLENLKLLEKLGHNFNTRSVTEPSNICAEKFNEMLQLCEKAKIDYNCLKQENMELRKNVSTSTTASSTVGLYVAKERLDELWHLSNKALLEYNAIKNKLAKETNKSNDTSSDKTSFVPVLEDLSRIADKAAVEYKQQSQDLAALKQSYRELENKLMERSTHKRMLDEQSTKLILSDESSKQLQMDNDKFIEEGRHKDFESELSKLQNDLDELRLENANLQCLINSISSSQSKQKLESMSDLRDELLRFQKSSDEYQKLYEQKEREHYELLDEMRELNEALKARGDLISRQQEERQLLEIEFKNNTEALQKIQQQIEEKNNELKEYQIQFDIFKQNSENAKLKIETLENTSLLNEEKVRILNAELEMLRSVQSNADMDNQSEILSTSTITKVDEIQRLKDVEDTFEDKYNKIRGLAAKLKKKLQDETSQKQQLEKEIYNLRTHENEMKTKLEDLQTNVNEIDSLKSLITDKQKQIDSLKTENQKLKSSRKQANVLNLEIEAAEKSLTEVTNKLATRTSELDAAQDMLKTKDSTINQLRKEIELLESSKLAETKHSRDLRDQIDHLQNTLKDAVHSKQQAFEKTKLLEQDVENLKLELESVRVELANVTSNFEKSLSALKSEKEEISLQLSTTNETLSSCEYKLKQANRITEDLRVEYLDYKVKAQAVLRKNQTRDSSKERELEEELLTIKASETQLKTANEMLYSKLEVIEKEKEAIAIDNASLQKRTKELMEIIEEIRTQNDSLSQEVQQHVQQQHETLKQHRKQIESMDKCHKEHVQSINTNHQRQLEQLSKEISNNVRLPPTVGSSKLSPHTSDPSQLIDQVKLDFLLMEREDAEGSEEATETLATLAASRKISNASSSNAKRSQHDFMPLDELLNTPINAISSETLITTPMQIPDNINNNMDLLQLELNSTKEHLQKQESHVRHLTALLAENEQDLAKLTQMNDMLKEELRRQERSVEREQHMHNSEYIKNVIMKFLTLNNADEKTRLVPVLNTILKLSRAETDMLNCVAKGQKVLESSPRGSGWGNFLPWGGGGGTGNNNN